MELSVNDLFGYVGSAVEEQNSHVLMQHLHTVLQTLPFNLVTENKQMELFQIRDMISVVHQHCFLVVCFNKPSMQNTQGLMWSYRGQGILAMKTYLGCVMSLRVTATQVQ